MATEKEEHRHHQHHHHHHHHVHSTSDSSFVDTVKNLSKVQENGKKWKDSTSKFRNDMQQRRLRKKIMERLVFVLMLLLTLLVLVGVMYAYFIDK